MLPWTSCNNTWQHCSSGFPGNSPAICINILYRVKSNQIKGYINTQFLPKRNIWISYSFFTLFTALNFDLNVFSFTKTWNCNFCHTVFFIFLSLLNFLSYRVLEKTSGVENPGDICWKLFGYLLVAHCIALCIYAYLKSVESVESNLRAR